MTGIILLVEFIILSLIARFMQQTMYLFFLMIFRAQSIAVTCMTVLLFPGTVIHELSHLFVAEIMGVRTGTLTLVPEAIEGKTDEMRAGSVAVAKTDPFRRSLIGIAPLIVGLAALSGISYYLFTHVPDLSTLWQLAVNREPFTIIVLVLFYLIFAISNSMFSSPEDLKGVIPFAIVIAIFIGASYLAGLRIQLTGVVLEVITTLISSLTKTLGLVLALNGVLLLTLKLLIAGIGKIRR